MGFFDEPLFDFNGDGKTDALELSIILENDPCSKQNEKSDEFKVK